MGAAVTDLPPGFVLEGQSQAAALPPGFQLEQAQPSPTDGMSTMDRLRAGIGQGMTDVALGAEQLAAHHPEIMAALGNPSAMFMPQQAQQGIDAEAAQKAQMDAALLDTGAGKVGSVVGNIAATAPLGALGKAPQAASWLTKLATAAKAGAAAGGVGGAVQPVAGDDYDAEKLKQAGMGVAGGAVGGSVLSGLGRVAEAIVPKNVTATLVNTINKAAAKNPFAQEGEQLAQQTGVALTPAQVTGSKAANMAENAARQSIFSRDIAFAGDKARIQQLSDYFDKTLDGVTKSNASPAIAGDQVRAATRSVVDRLSSMRAKQATQDYGVVRQMTQGSRMIEPDNLRAELADLVTTHGEMGTPSSDALASFAKRQLQGGSTDGSLDKLLLLRQHLSKVSGGQAKISGDAQDKMIARNLLSAIDNDLDMNADKIGGDVGAALKQANSTYRGYSQQIDSVKASPLGKVLGDDFAGALQSGQFNSIAPETVMQRLSTLKPTEIGVVRGILEKDQPEAWAVMKRSVLEDALEKAKAMPASDGANTAVLRPNVLIKNLGDAKKLQAMFDPSELSQIQAGLDVARRLSDKTGYNFSGTAGQNEALSLMNGAKNLSVKGMASLGGEMFGTRALAKMMTNADGRMAMMELSRLPASSQRARQLVAQLSAMAAQGNDDPMSAGGQ